MTVDQLADVFVGTLVLGAIYALVGIGIVILFKATGMLNFAQGVFMVAGASLFYWGVTGLSLHWTIALLFAAAIMAVIGVVVYLLLFRRLIGAELLPLVILSLGLGVVGHMVLAFIWGPNVRLVPPVLGFDPVEFGGPFSATKVEIFTVLVAVVIIGILEFSLQRTRVGVRMRAVADRPFLASFVGINVHAVSAAAWAISSLCAGVAGAAYAMRSTVDPVGINILGLVALPAVLLGGMDSIRGALVGGLLLALLQNLASTLFGGEWSTVLAYVVLLAVLLVRPSGLFGKAEIARL